MLNQKTQCQEISTSAPPSTGPITRPTAATIVFVPIARPSWLRGKASVTSAAALAKIAAPPMPCRIRQRMSCVPSAEKPAPSEATREEREAEDVRALAAEEVRQPAGREDEHGRGDHVGEDHPDELQQRGVEAALEVGQGDDQRPRVDRREQHPEARARQRPPLVVLVLGVDADAAPGGDGLAVESPSYVNVSYQPGWGLRAPLSALGYRGSGGPPSRPSRCSSRSRACLAMAVTGLVALASPGGHERDAAMLHGFAALDRPRVHDAVVVLAHLADPLPYLLVGVGARSPGRWCAACAWRAGSVVALLVSPARARRRSSTCSPSRASRRGSASHQVGAASWPSGHSTAAMTLALCAVLVAPACAAPGRRGARRRVRRGRRLRRARPRVALPLRRARRLPDGRAVDGAGGRARCASSSRRASAAPGEPALALGLVVAAARGARGRRDRGRAARRRRALRRRAPDARRWARS